MVRDLGKETPIPWKWKRTSQSRIRRFSGTSQLVLQSYSSPAFTLRTSHFNTTSAWSSCHVKSRFPCQSLWKPSKYVPRHPWETLVYKGVPFIWSCQHPFHGFEISFYKCCCTFADAVIVTIDRSWRHTHQCYFRWLLPDLLSNLQKTGKFKKPLTTAPSICNATPG